MPKTKNSTTAGYAGSKKRTNLSLSSELVSLARKYFPLTAHGSVSGFVDSCLRRELSSKAPRIRKCGLTIPGTVFEK